MSFDAIAMAMLTHPYQTLLIGVLAWHLVRPLASRVRLGGVFGSIRALNAGRQRV